MSQNSSKTVDLRTSAIDCITVLFLNLFRTEGQPLEKLEDLCLTEGHMILAMALGNAIEQYDTELCSNLPVDLRVHDRRERVLATKMGDVRFRYRRCRDKANNSVIPLADALDIPWNARISPGATSFLVEAGANVSFTSAARLLTKAGGSVVSPTAVMNAIHLAGQLCEEEDRQAAKSLYCDGAVPEADSHAEDICIEADGTWIRLQETKEDKPKHVEIKAMVSYVGKETQGTKTSRVQAIHHGCVGTSRQFWTQSVATIGSRFDLTSIKHVHFGCDGEAMYKQGASYLPMSIESDTHLDPFHVNRAVLSCFKSEDRKLANNILGCVIDGDIEVAATLIDAAEAGGLAKKNSSRVSSYLRNNVDIIYTEGPNLGTMEAEQQHVYGCRMDAFPCAWSYKGADAMARLRSRTCSKRAIPQLTREQSATPRRRKRKEQKELAYLESTIKTCAPMSVGKGYEAEHSASLMNVSREVRYTAGPDSCMVGVGW